MAAHLVDASRAMPTAAFVVAPALSWMPSNGQRPIAVPSRRAAAREDRPQGRSHGQAAVVAFAVSSIALARQGGMGSASRRRRQAACRPATVVAASGTRDRSWEALSEDLKERPEGRRLLAAEKDIKEGTIPHTDAKVRYFSESREKPRVVLYRDTAAWCPYCQKVWLLLEAKQVDYITEKVNMRSYGEKTDAFMRKASPQTCMAQAAQTAARYTRTVCASQTLHSAQARTWTPRWTPRSPRSEPHVVTRSISSISTGPGVLSKTHFALLPLHAETALRDGSWQQAVHHAAGRAIAEGLAADTIAVLAPCLRGGDALARKWAVDVIAEVISKLRLLPADVSAAAKSAFAMAASPTRPALSTAASLSCLSDGVAYGSPRILSRMPNGTPIRMPSVPAASPQFTGALSARSPAAVSITPLRGSPPLFYTPGSPQTRIEPLAGATSALGSAQRSETPVRALSAVFGFSPRRDLPPGATAVNLASQLAAAEEAPKRKEEVCLQSTEHDFEAVSRALRALRSETSSASNSFSGLSSRLQGVLERKRGLHHSSIGSPGPGNMDPVGQTSLDQKEVLCQILSELARAQEALSGMIAAVRADLQLQATSQKQLQEGAKAGHAGGAVTHPVLSSTSPSDTDGLGRGGNDSSATTAGARSKSKVARKSMGAPTNAPLGLSRLKSRLSSPELSLVTQPTLPASLVTEPVLGSRRGEPSRTRSPEPSFRRSLSSRTPRLQSTQRSGGEDSARGRESSPLTSRFLDSSAGMSSSSPPWVPSGALFQS
ncbi:unnamed protein product [Polarella glacialis]|uniref:GST N-terminal domain-containing protein n=1 Tax=Polarella glacialis TaxID=89957 RepID=A0A813DT81_POLGL|nr:unnamed protein product [Polarella glacialis]